MNELTYLLFLKMSRETGTERELPRGFRWEDLAVREGDAQFNFYRGQLVRLGTHGKPHIRAIFANPTSLLRNATTLNSLVQKIDEISWFSIDSERMGDIYEGLLQRNSNEKKSGAGQYFTPRPLVDSMVTVMKPRVADIIQDPAAGTAGFLIAAKRHILQHSGRTPMTAKQERKLRRGTFFGMEHVHDTHRLALMNLLLHGLPFDPDGAGIRYGDTLSEDGMQLPKATLILTNPPFGTKSGGGLPERNDFPFPTSNKQLCFLQHIYGALRPNGRAAVVLPDNVLFEGNIARQIRVDLMEKCNLHTILRLPSGIFYAPGVKTNVLFFTRGETDSRNTREVWIFDLRANMQPFNKRNPLLPEHFAEFEAAFGDDPQGGREALAGRIDLGTEGRFRRFDRAWIAERSDSLNINWLKDESTSAFDGISEPAELARLALDDVEAIASELQAILADLGEEVEL